MAQKTVCPTCGRDLEAVRLTGEFTVPRDLIAAADAGAAHFTHRVPNTGPAPAQSCSYCGKSADQVKRLLTGQTAQICDECVSLCHMVLVDELPDFQ
jgi:hypothetical protein